VRKILGFLLFVGALCYPVVAQVQSPIRVRCGGPSYTDASGQVWQADYGFNVGTPKIIREKTSNTSDPALYQTARWNGNSAVPLVYAFQVPNGSYHVNLYLAEAVLLRIGARVFDVKMQGSMVFPHLDIFREAGANASLVKGAQVTVSNGTLSIEFDNVTDYAKVNAIEILPGTSGPGLALNFKYPDGTPVSGKLIYVVSSSLLNLQGSQPLINGFTECTLLANPSSLGISTQFQVQLSLVDDAGHRLWQINLGMNPAEVNLAAVQASALNVTVQKL
jgi:hypothetical protein